MEMQYPRCSFNADGLRKNLTQLLKWAPAAIFICIATLAHAQYQWQFHTYDEFNGALHDDVDPTKWVPADVTPAYWGSGSPDAVTYCSRGSTSNTCSLTSAYPYELDGQGHLIIHATDTGTTRSVTDNIPTSGHTSNQEVYNSGRLEGINDSTHQFRYGRFEARIQVPKGQGAWPAFWLLGANYNKALSNPGSMAWPETGEIDILENWSVNSDAVDLTPLKQNQGSHHGPTSPTTLFNSILDQGATYTSPTVDLGDDFHTYAIDWLPGEIDFYVDGVLYGRRSPALLTGQEIWELDAIDGSTPRTQYPILNLEVGTVHNGLDYPVTTGTVRTPTNLIMTVDYVRHYTFLLASQTLPAFFGNADLGGGGPNTSASYSGGTFTVTASGNAFDTAAGSSSHQPNDQLHYVYRPLYADGTYSVKVGSQTGTLTHTAGGGLMIRDGRAAYAQFVSTWISPDNVVHFQSRVSQAAVSSATYGNCGPYLRIVKSGTTFTGGCSADGTTWTTTGAVTITFSNHELAGLVAFAGGNPIAPSFADVLNTVMFTNLSFPSGKAPWDGNAPALPQPPYKGVVPATLVQAENYDVGGQGIAYNTSGTNTTNYRVMENVYIDACSDYTTTGTHGTKVGGFMVSQTHAGQWMDYTINVTTAGTYKISTRVASSSSGGTFHFELDGSSVGGTLTIPATGGWDTWQTVTTSSINFSSTGIHSLRLVMDSEGASGNVGNFDLFTIAP